MSPLLFLTGIGFAAAFGYAVRDTSKLQKNLRSVKVKSAKTKFLSLVEKLLLCAQLTEIAHTMQHATILDVLIIVGIFGLWLGLKSGTETASY